MSAGKFPLACAALFAAFAATPVFGATQSDVESQPTEAGVRAVEDHWSRAFLGGDTTYLDRLLMPSYVSVSGKGVVRDRATIEQLAAAYAKKNPTPVAAMKSDTESTYEIEGAAAVVKHYSPSNHERSVDVFVYKDGAWYAVYSQHTTIAQ